MVGALVGDTVGDLVGLRHGRRLKWCLSIIGDTVDDLVGDTVFVPGPD